MKKNKMRFKNYLKIIHIEIGYVHLFNLKLFCKELTLQINFNFLGK